MARKWNTTKVVDGARIVFEFRAVSRTSTFSPERAGDALAFPVFISKPPVVFQSPGCELLEKAGDRLRHIMLNTNRNGKTYSRGE